MRSKTDPGQYLTKRQQQIMAIIGEKGRATAAEIQEMLPGSPSNSAVRTLLGILEERGHLAHDEEGGRFVYFATDAHSEVGRNALAHVLQTFFRGSVTDAVATLLSDKEAGISDAEISELQALIDASRLHKEQQP